MKVLAILPLLFALACGVSLSDEKDAEKAKAEGDGKDKGKGKEGKGDKGGKRAEGEKDGTLVGTLAEKGADAKDGVAAVLVTKKGEKYNLLATGDQAAKLAELAKTGADVRIGGDITPDGVKVLKIAERDKGDKGKGEGGDKPKGDGGDKPKGDGDKKIKKEGKAVKIGGDAGK